MKRLDKEACVYRMLLALVICGLAIYDGDTVAIVAAAVVVYGFGYWWGLQLIWADHCARFRRPGTSIALKRATLGVSAFWFLILPFQIYDWLAGKWRHLRRQELRRIPENASQSLT